jgi:hypothetical protein
VQPLISLRVGAFHSLLRERFPRQAQIPGIRLCRIRGKWQQTLLCGRLRIQHGCLGFAKNAVVGGLRVSNVRGGGRRHVAYATVGFLGFVFGTEFVAMACQAFAATVGSRLLLRRSEVRVMATDTPHLVGRFSFADTLRECFGLAERAKPVIRVAAQNEIVDEVRQLVSRLKIGQGTPRLLDGDATFEMAPHADGIAPIGRQLREVHNRSQTTTVAETRAATEVFSDWGYGRS